MRPRAPNVLVASLALWLGGCRLFTDFGEFEVVEDAGVAYTFDVFVADLASRMCDRARRCEDKSSTAADEQMACAHVPGAASTSVFELYLEDFAPHAEVRFDETLARACVDAIDTTLCELSSLPRTCAFLRAGDAPLDAICAADADCATGRCAGEPSSCDARRCAELGEASETCADDWDCDDPLRCIAGTCEVARAESETCAATSECEPGLWCDAIGGEPACRAQPDEEGEPCAIDAGYDPCAGPLVCVAGECARGAESGEVCDDVSALCAPGTRCVAGSCVTIGERDDACVSRNDCPKFFDCVSEQCVPRPVAGESCDVGRACAVGRCDSGTCVVPNAGASCVAPELDFLPACEEVCDVSFDPDRCVARKMNGSGCANDGECESGYCVGDPSTSCTSCSP